MTVVSTTPDTSARTLTVVAELAAAPERVWQLWTDPRQLERWWGPPTWPATFTRHEAVPDGSSAYSMTGPGGERAHGWWRFVSLEEPTALEFEDGFSHADGSRDEGLPTMRVSVALEEAGSGTRMTVLTRFATTEAMEQVLAMGMAEGMTQAVGQMDEVLVAA